MKNRYNSKTVRQTDLKKRLNSTPTITRKTPTQKFRWVFHVFLKPISRDPWATVVLMQYALMTDDGTGN